VLAPNDFNDTAEVARRLNQFEHHYNQIAEPFDWNFTREKARRPPRSSRPANLARPARRTRRLTRTRAQAD
jgi:hypothetical protein